MDTNPFLFLLSNLVVYTHIPIVISFLRHTTRHTNVRKRAMPDYPIKVGTLVHTDGVEYNCPPSFSDLVAIVTHGNIIELTPDLEVWAYRDQAAIVFNEIGVLE